MPYPSGGNHIICFSYRFRTFAWVAAQRLRVCPRAFTYSLRFSCKLACFQSGAEGIRTPDLRRAKADS